MFKHYYKMYLTVIQNYIFGRKHVNKDLEHPYVLSLVILVNYG